ncbi:MAG: formate--tetrahydrofolate ligase [Bacilli bacterium]|nr:formate--tetrahydrofolate ligase [Bacilli bacterium]
MYKGGVLMTDYEIYKKTTLLPIKEIAAKLNLREKDISLYGDDKAKIKINEKNLPDKNSKLILVTSTSPTPYGEGKTTLSIGINDALCALNKKSVVVLREPSLGPVFGTKGGATGGGMSQVAPMDDINLHFTGDIHAVTSANNLLCAIIDNHIFRKEEPLLDKDTISINRCLDVNDRALRDVFLPIVERADAFSISVASEIMAILCLAEDIEDLKERLGNIFIGYSLDKKEVYAKDLKAEGAMTVLLKDAIYPNLVQTLEKNPAIIHGGPFANIAHGCNSVMATKLGLKLADYVITEAGFGSDMGALKFFDIKCRKANIYPDAVVINTTVKSLVYNGEGFLEKGIQNLNYHIQNMQGFTNHILVVLNQFEKDTEEEILFIQNHCKSCNVAFEISTCYTKGSAGGMKIAEKLVEMTQQKTTPTAFIYQETDTLQDKINSICKQKYHASAVILERKAEEKLAILEQSKHAILPICIAKTPYSISDQPKRLGYPKDFTMTVTDIKLNSGAGFITVYMGDVMTMPGLAKHANYEKMDLIDNQPLGLF